ncbi:hypothetical protein FNE58_19450 [Bacillus thuringiensis]|uniref:Uncharacterized protein n=1 Tax=Bacillus thuringiensis subsp. tolworthi TaxID=1442 RepID=A0A9W4EXW2_BACTO|nr:MULTISPECIES: hypothetical protein [Bacillus cereus group]MDR5041612.1 hypothetical protein [Bacillus thuringiensis]MEB9590231.1 hypothetical protein [Bacillus cereus]BAR87895.1 uncharacterized protein KNN_07162 [Bacillus thuringiensis serovar tolworthi]
MKIHDKDFKTSQELSDAIFWELAEYQTIITLALSNCSKEEVSKILKTVERGERFSSTTKEWLKQNVEMFHKPKWDKGDDSNDRHAKSN